MYSARGAAFDVGRKLSVADPMVAMLRALIEKTIETPAASAGAQPLRELILSAARQAFFAEDDATLLPYLDTSKKRLQVAELLIDRHLTEPYLGGKWLAGQIGVSPRTLQEDFQGRGTTCTTVIRNRRLYLAREKIEQIHIDRAARTISEIAYDCGFNDISYFNRSFKEMFSCAPGDMLKLLPV
jgi:AraC-like DNA-binding protein